SWLGGTPDRLIARFLDILFAFPSILFAVLAVIALGAGLIAPVIALSVAYTPYIARVIRAAAGHEPQLPYIAACQLLGYSSLPDRRQSPAPHPAAAHHRPGHHPLRLRAA